MYEDRTYEVLLREKLARVASALDKREGSIIYDALAPNSLESAMIYAALDLILTETYAGTASRTYLIRRCADRGIEPLPATRAVGVGKFSKDVPLGARFSCDRYNWAVTEKTGPGAYYLTCETAGADPNNFIGPLIPVEYIDGLASAELTEIAVNGEDEEETEALRARYLASFSSQAYGFNRRQYIDVVGAMPDVGGVKPYRATRAENGVKVPDSPGHVTLVITNSEFDVPTDTVVDRVQTVIDPTQNAGEGVGLAAIDHEVHVLPVTGRRIDVRSRFTFSSGWSFEECKPYLEQAVADYLKDVDSQWADSETLVVRLSQLETKLLSVKGVLDLEGTTLNGVAQNLELGPDEIAVLGEVADG